MKKTRGFFALCLTLCLMLGLCAGVQAAEAPGSWDDYDGGYDAGYDAGYKDGSAAAARGEEDPEVPYDDYRYDGETYDEGYACGYVDGFWEGYMDAWDYDAYWQQQMDQEKEDLGGSAQGINVMIDGKCVTFPDVKPELVGGRILVPFRAFFESQGAQVRFESKDDSAPTAVAVLNGRTYRNELGTASLFVEEDGQRREVVMDCGSGITRGRTVLPLRFMAEAMGWYVDWDAEYETAVLINVPEFIQNTDEKLSLVNSLLKQHSRQGTWEEKADATVSWTAFDTIRGSKTYTVSGKLNSLRDEKAWNLTASLDLRQLAGLFQEAGILDEDTGTILESVIKAEAIAVPEQDALYATVSGLEQNIWGQMSLEGLAEELDWQGDGQMTAAGLLWQYAKSQYRYDAFHLYENLAGTAETLTTWLGDDGFTRSGAAYSRRWTAESVLKELEQQADPEQWEWIREDLAQSLGTLDASVSIVKGTAGRSTGSWQAKWSTEDLVLSGKGQLQSERSSLELQLHVKNVGEGKLNLRVSGTQSEKTVKTQPPAGAMIAPLDELLAPEE